jgi:hypothetical protein
MLVLVPFLNQHQQQQQNNFLNPPIWILLLLSTWRLQIWMSEGPFEGDLVESVEFCFKKAPDRDDKQGDGEEGGPGPTGGYFKSMQVITTNELGLLLP